MDDAPRPSKPPVFQRGVGEPLGAHLSAWLRFADRGDVELLPGVTVVGRGDRCQIVIDDPLISRRHACFVVDAQSVMLKDLGSMNGVLVNGMKVDGTCVLAPGDRITLGRAVAELCVGRRSSKSDRLARTMPRMTPNTVLEAMGPDSADAEPTRKGSILQMLGSVADKAFVLGRGEEAEKLVKRPMESLLQRATEGRPVDGEEVEIAALLATRLARSTTRGAWIDYVFRLYTALGEPLPGSVIEELYANIRYVTKVELVAFRDYLERLHGDLERLGPAERFLIRRIEGLEPLLVSAS